MTNSSAGFSPVTSLSAFTGALMPLLPALRLLTLRGWPVILVAVLRDGLCVSACPLRVYCLLYLIIPLICLAALRSLNFSLMVSRFSNVVTIIFWGAHAEIFCLSSLHDSGSAFFICWLASCSRIASLHCPYCCWLVFMRLAIFILRPAIIVLMFLLLIAIFCLELSLALRSPNCPLNGLITFCNVVTSRFKGPHALFALSAALLLCSNCL